MTDIKKILTTVTRSPLLCPGKDIALTMLLLDRSSSMSQYGETPLRSANECIDTLRHQAGAKSTLAGLWTFADDVTNDIPIQPLINLPQLAGYDACGNTALYDAVGNALHMGLELQNAAKNRHGVKMHVAVSVITDGEDTCSRHPRQRLVTFAQHAKDAGFALQVIGIGIDHVHLAQVLGFEPGYSCTVDNTVAGVRQATHTASVLFSRTMMYGNPRDSSQPPSSDSR
ncbi:MAG: vWA domain-containing protein [Patescibacteria group bacterium]